MARRAHSFRFIQRHPWKEDAEFAVFAVLIVVFATFFTFQSLKFAGFIMQTDEPTDPLLQGAVLERAVYEGRETDASFNVLPDHARSAGAGEQNVALLSFTLSSSKAARVQRMVFSASGPMDPRDLKTLQLYIDGEFQTERAFFDEQGRFDDVRLRLHPGQEVRVDVTGQVSEEARAGHRLQIGFAYADDIAVQSIASEPLTLDMEFPVWGPAVSIIGQRL